MEKVLLFYKYAYIDNPKRMVKWQKQICRNLALTGRILIAEEGINGTVSGQPDNVDRYAHIMRENPFFTDVDFKESMSDVPAFPKLRVVVRDEIVTLGVDPKEVAPTDGGQHLTPEETHALLSAQPKDLVVFDARNAYESAIGAFKNAITPNIQNFRDLPEYIDHNIDVFKDKEVIMYCTGGVRCERATAYLNKKGVAKKVYQMDGGIHRYAQTYPDGFFRGKNYVFDSRIAVKINDDVLGTCALCNTACNEYTNCLNALCNKHFICCPTCIKTLSGTCSTTCQELVANKQVTMRKPLREYQVKDSM